MATSTVPTARVDVIVTNLPMEPDRVLGFYNQRGTAEQHIKEGKYTFHRTRLSLARLCAPSLPKPRRV